MLITGEAISLATGEVVLLSTVEASLLIASEEFWLIKGKTTRLISDAETFLAVGEATLLVAGEETLLAAGGETLLAAGVETLLAAGDAIPLAGGGETLLAAGGETLLAAGEETLLAAGGETLLTAGKETLLVAIFFLATREESFFPAAGEEILLFNGLQGDKSISPTKGDATDVGVTWITKGLSTSSTTAELILVVISFVGLLLVGLDTLLVMCVGSLQETGKVALPSSEEPALLADGKLTLILAIVALGSPAKGVDTFSMTSGETLLAKGLVLTTGEADFLITDGKLLATGRDRLFRVIGRVSFTDKFKAAIETA